MFEVNYLRFNQGLKEPIYKNIYLCPQIFENLPLCPKFQPTEFIHPETFLQSPLLKEGCSLFIKCKVSCR